MKKNYTFVEVNVISLESADVITLSFTGFADKDSNLLDGLIESVTQDLQ